MLQIVGEVLLAGKLLLWKGALLGCFLQICFFFFLGLRFDVLLHLADVLLNYWFDLGLINGLRAVLVLAEGGGIVADHILVALIRGQSSKLAFLIGQIYQAHGSAQICCFAGAAVRLKGRGAVG